MYGTLMTVIATFFSSTRVVLKRRVWLGVSMLALVALALSNPKSDAFRAAASPPPEQVLTVPLYRLRNDGHQFLYTIDPNEMAALQKQKDWTYEGVRGYVLPKKIPGAVEVYRLRKSGGTEGTTVLNLYSSSWDYFFYTADKKEADNAANNLGWRIEGVAFYVSPKQVADTIALNRYYSPPHDVHEVAVTDHYGESFFYTTDPKDPYLPHSALTFQRVEAYVWQQAVTLDAGTGLLASKTNVNVIKPTPAPAINVQDELFSLGCSQDAGKKQITCPSIQGWELCNFYKNKGDLKVSFCATTVDQFAFANIETDLTAHGCTRFLGRAGQYLCRTLSGAQTCDTYLKKKDGMVTKCLSVKQEEMNKDLLAHGCKSFLGRADDFYCTAEGMKTCTDYRLDGRVKTCRLNDK
ncbi:MAG: hypothetical protein ACJ741_02560 [Pyrinomonadaceae bacterium]